jgi:hypothetical protein
MDDAHKPPRAPALSDVASPEAEANAVLSSLLEAPAFVGHTPAPAAPSACLIGVCIDDRHPTLLGRARIRWTTSEGRADAWVPLLSSLVVRTGDQVLITQPANGPEPVVVGVVDGFAHRPAAPHHSAASLTLEKDEALQIRDARGRPLLELRSSDDGPVVRLLSSNLAFEVEGKLAFRAAAIRVEASSGSVEIEAADDVCVKGEVIHLN